MLGNLPCALTCQHDVSLLHPSCTRKIRLATQFSFDGNNASIIPTAPVVAVENACNQCGMRDRQAGIIGQIPSRGNAIAVQDDSWLCCEGVIKRADSRCDMARSAIVRNHAAYFAGLDDGRGDVADAAEGDAPRGQVDVSYCYRGAARGRQSAMDCFG